MHASSRVEGRDVVLVAYTEIKGSPVSYELDAGRESVTPSNRYNDNGPPSLARLGNLAKAKYRHTHACTTHRY